MTWNRSNSKALLLYIYANSSPGTFVNYKEKSRSRRVDTSNKTRDTCDIGPMFQTYCMAGQKWDSPSSRTAVPSVIGFSNTPRYCPLSGGTESK